MPAPPGGTSREVIDESSTTCGGARRLFLLSAVVYRSEVRQEEGPESRKAWRVEQYTREQNKAQKSSVRFTTTDTVRWPLLELLPRCVASSYRTSSSLSSSSSLPSSWSLHSKIGEQACRLGFDNGRIQVYLLSVTSYLSRVTNLERGERPFYRRPEYLEKHLQRRTRREKILRENAAG